MSTAPSTTSTSAFTSGAYDGLFDGKSDSTVRVPRPGPRSHGHDISHHDISYHDSHRTPDLRIEGRRVERNIHVRSPGKGPSSTPTINYLPVSDRRISPDIFDMSEHDIRSAIDASSSDRRSIILGNHRTQTLSNLSMISTIVQFICSVVTLFLIIYISTRV